MVPHPTPGCRGLCHGGPAAGSVVACSSDPSPGESTSRDSAASTQGCVDFVVKVEETTCTSAADCTFVDATRVCPRDPSCGGQVPTNRAGRARYDSETGAIARTQVACGAAAPEACVAGRCVVCSNPGACPDGG